MAYQKEILNNQNYIFHFFTENQCREAKYFLEKKLFLESSIPVEDTDKLWVLEILCSDYISQSVIGDFLENYGILEEGTLGLWNRMIVSDKARIQLPIFKDILDMVTNLVPFNKGQILGALGQLFADLINYKDVVLNEDEFINILHVLRILSSDNKILRPMSVEDRKVVFTDTNEVLYKVGEFDSFISRGVI